MTYVQSNDWWVQAQRRDQRIGLITAVFIHIVLLLIGAKIFMKSVQFSVRSSPNQSVEVDLIEPSHIVVQQEAEEPKPVLKQDDFVQPVEEKKQEVVKVEEEVKPTVHTQPSGNVRVDANPDYFQNPAPPYPELAKQMRQAGLVILDVDVDREGMPIKVEIAQSSGYRLLDQSALKAVSHWKFQPGQIGDLPVESKVEVPVRFQLQEDQR